MMKILVLFLGFLVLQNKGDKAPEITLKNQAGEEVKLADLKGKKSILLAFYFKDATPG